MDSISNLIQKAKAAVPYLKKAASYATGVAAAIAGVVQFIDGNYDGMWTAFGIAGAAFGLNLPAHIQTATTAAK